MTVDYRVGKVLELVDQLPDGSVDLVATSPPFLNLRDYNDPKQLASTTTNPEYREQSSEFRDPPPPTSDSRGPAPGPADEGDGLTLAAELLALAGLARPEPNPGEVLAVERALARGWPLGELRAMALQASGALVDPRAYLRQCLVRAMNDPPPDAAPAEPRPLLDDARPACPTCGGSSMVGGLGPDGIPDGSPVDRCPDCTGVRA